MATHLDGIISPVGNTSAMSVLIIIIEGMLTEASYVILLDMESVQTASVIKTNAFKHCPCVNS